MIDSIFVCRCVRKMRSRSTTPRSLKVGSITKIWLKLPQVAIFAHVVDGLADVQKPGTATNSVCMRRPAERSG